MKVDFRKVLQSSLLIILIAIALVVSSILLRLLPILIEGPEADTVGAIATIYTFILFPVFLVLYFWGGMRATRRFRLDAIGAGIAGSFAFFVTGIVQFLLEMVLALLFASHVLAGTFVSGAATMAAAVFGQTAAGGTGLALSALCGLGMIVIGTLINFAVAGLGSLVAQR
jgi:hypothetical protein